MRSYTLKISVKLKKGNSIEVERYISNIDIKNRKQRELFWFIKRLPPKYRVNLSTEVTLLQPSSIRVFGAKDMNTHIIILNYEKESEMPSNVVKIPSNALLLILPVLSKDIEKLSITLLDFVINFLKEMEIVSLTSNIKTKKEPIRFEKSYKLEEDGSNLANIVHMLHLEHPEAIEDISKKLSLILERNVRVSPHITDDGRVYIRIIEDGLELNPTMISDGTWKILTILTILESINRIDNINRPLLLLLDEIENSIHPKAIEFIIDELKHANITTIATTHSPAVVDIVEPEDLLLVEKDEEGATNIRRINEPDKLKEKMREYGITLSEGWLYGNI